MFKKTISSLAVVGILWTACFDCSMGQAIDGSEEAPKVSFSFDRVTWREVFQWLAVQSDLALHINDLPQGTFTYLDPSEYSPEEAIARVNLFLIPEGFAVIRSEKLLTVLGLNDTTSLQQLDALARPVVAGELENQPKYDLVKVVWALDKLSPSLVVAEIQPLKVILPPVVLPNSNQLVIVETVEKQRLIGELIRAMEAKMLAQKPVVKRFELVHLTLDEFLAIAGTHLGIPAGQTSSTQLTISTDVAGKKLFVTATEEASQLLADLIATVDQSENLTAPEPTSQVMKSHRVPEESLRLAYDVLHTLLADKPIRLSMEVATSSIVALAEPEIHTLIEETIQELSGAETEFQVVYLKSLDPYFTVALLNEMFDLDNRAKTGDSFVPRVDADPVGMRLFLRGPKEKIEELKSVIESLDSQEHSGTQRLVPIVGPRAADVIEVAKATWRRRGRIQTEDSMGPRANISERIVGQTANQAMFQDPSSEENKIADSRKPANSPASFISTAVQEDSRPKPEVKTRLTPRGVVLESSDENVLNQFEDHLRSIAADNSTGSVVTVVYYLKHSTANEATRLLSDLLDGATSVLNANNSTPLVNGNVPISSVGNIFGTYLRNQDGAMMVNSGTLTVVADERLNRLICLGTTQDMTLVEQYLEVIDRDQSLTQIETHGVSHVIQLQNTRAEDVVEVIREAYGERVALSNKEKIQQAAAQANDRSRSEREPTVKTQVSRSSEPQLHVAVHVESNSVVVTAPEALFKDVQALVLDLDEKASQAVEVIFYPDKERIESLQSILGGGKERSGGTSRK
ncbi:MAG: hypothetical protein KDB03_18290 [Planctomycetales bacterium]|nr:hypothetical protein [Planctomycetales bacterium]